MGAGGKFAFIWQLYRAACKFVGFRVNSRLFVSSDLSALI
jgi:hypothetical protein